MSRGGIIGVAAVLTAIGAAPVWAEEEGGTSAPDKFSPAELKHGPSITETGRVGVMTPVPLPPAAVPIQPEPVVGDTGEKSIRKAAATLGTAPTKRVGTIDADTLHSEVQERF